MHNPLRHLLKKFANPKKHCTLQTKHGVFQSRIVYTFFGSIELPSRETTYPRSSLDCGYKNNNSLVWNKEHILTIL